VALFGHKINYIFPVFEFSVITCNQKHVGRIPVMSLHSVIYRATFFMIFVWLCWELTYFCWSVRTLLEKGLTDTLIWYLFLLQSWNLCHSWKKKIFLEVSFRTKFLHWQVYGFLIYTARYPSTKYSGTLKQQTNKCKIWSFRSEADEKCALLGY